MPRIEDDYEESQAAPVEPLNGHSPIADGKLAGVRIAVNFLDLERLSPFVRESFFGKGCNRLGRSVVRIDKGRADEVGTEMRCPLLEAACVLDTIRSHDRKVGDFPTRVYIFRKAWSKLPAATLLSVMSNGRPILNPAVFDVQLEAAEVELPPQEALDFGQDAATEQGGD